MAITFDETLIMGVPELDRQHRELFRRLDALIEAIRRGSSRDEIAHTLAFLREYVGVHFEAEEAVMRAAGYGALDAHRAEHDRFVRDLAAFETEHRRDGATPSLIVRVNARLRGWLAEHLYRSDRELGTFLRANGRG
jgi:hemerythrin